MPQFHSYQLNDLERRIVDLIRKEPQFLNESYAMAAIIAKRRVIQEASRDLEAMHVMMGLALQRSEIDRRVDDFLREEE